MKLETLSSTAFENADSILMKLETLPIENEDSISQKLKESHKCIKMQEERWREELKSHFEKMQLIWSVCHRCCGRPVHNAQNMCLRCGKVFETKFKQQC